MVIFFAGFYEPGVSIIGAVLSVTSIVLMLFSQFTLYCAGLNACKMSALHAGSIGMNFIQGTLPFAIAVLFLTRAYPVATNVLVSANLALSTIIMLLSCCLSSKYSEGNELIEGALNSVGEYQGFDNINQQCISPFRLRGVLWEAFESGKIIEGFRLMRSLDQSILPAYSRARMLIRVAQLYGSTEEIVEEGLLIAYDDLEPHWDSRLVKDEALSFANKLVARAKLFKVLYLLGLPLDIISHSFAVFDRHESISVEL